MTTPETPSVARVRRYLSKWDKLDKYTLQESSLGLLFRDFCPKNDDVSHVLLKVSALNDFYSTNIFDTHAVARHILKVKPSQRIQAGDPTVVNEIARVSIGGKSRNFYSFASKYCNHHNPEPFPIYDSYVSKMLMHFLRVDRFSDFRKDDLKQYDRFVEIVRTFRSQYGLDEFSLRQIDIYLWLAGKEAFLRTGNEA